MRKILFITLFFPLGNALLAQTVVQKLQRAYGQFEKDGQLKYAMSSLYVVDAKTGAVVFDKHSQVGLAPASTQKIITAVTAFELLGKDYRYITGLGITGNIANNSLNGSIYLRASGDPTFGSLRFASTTPDKIFQSFADSLKRMGIKTASDIFHLQDNYFAGHVIPDGWIWQDIGNYYGAGSWPLNWRENQYDLTLQSGDKVPGPVTITENNGMPGQRFINRLGTAKKGSGDNAYIYLPVEGYDYVLEGTIPAGENRFRISGAIGNAPDYFINDFREYLKKQRFLDYPDGRQYHVNTTPIDDGNIIAWYHSPAMDSIIYFFLQKSINLYGEALIKTIGEKVFELPSTEAGITATQQFWKQKGLDENELNISDGSGLSPQNRVTTHAQVEILKYARKQSWFPSFYTALPEYNNMKMKSGTIRDVKGFCGYQKAKDGREYIFSFLVNNYSGSSPELVNKMYRVLDVLK